MITIWKYNLLAPRCTFLIPEGAKVLDVKIEPTGIAIPCIWMVVDTEKPLVKRKFRVFSTGVDMEYTAELDFKDVEEAVSHHVATFQYGERIWHLFEVTPAGMEYTEPVTH